MFEADAAAARADFDLTHMGGRKSGTVVACLSPSVPRRSLRCIHFHATNEAPPALHFTVGPSNHGSESRESSGLGLVQGATFGSLAKPRLVLPQIFPIPSRWLRHTLNISSPGFSWDMRHTRGPPLPSGAPGSWAGQLQHDDDDSYRGWQRGIASRAGNRRTGGKRNTGELRTVGKASHEVDVLQTKGMSTLRPVSHEAFASLFASGRRNSEEEILAIFIHPRVCPTKQTQQTQCSQPDTRAATRTSQVHHATMSHPR
jgi:hypothetical protein